ncbi:MAG: DUF4395 domain-containing protein [Paludibacter sp.]|nr:DUF4395 domain-containing protein [Paludibacter sp.]MDD4198200.1 DUF4395 domain-containing protein [Paludibacter sp.]MDD4426904.1 DUF4395 domain-containing protein [Paludibacter sp.]
MDEHVARLNGFFTVILLMIFLLTSSIIPVLFLVTDFFVRSIEKPQYSPLAIISKLILTKLKVNPQLINAGPKIFAARIGLLFSALISLAVLFGLNTTAVVLTLIFGICALLEAAVGFCVACKIYPFVYRLIQSNSDAPI